MIIRFRAEVPVEGLLPDALLQVSRSGTSVGFPSAALTRRNRPFDKYNSDLELPLQLGASVTSSLTWRADPVNRPLESTGATHRTLPTTKAIDAPSGDQIGPSSPRVPNERSGSAGI